MESKRLVGLRRATEAKLFKCVQSMENNLKPALKELLFRGGIDSDSVH